ncbi:MAG TPA: C1 family peptidase [Chitinophaga sp.]|uniref:C1 family peptidase n=1 Tax=Chitinophaga sp. TaxID=1869181 RepID=UPI002B72831D|nr:C1 family peptidase [Chitinophaga sp.]HVI47289.1 C1 family peptidase [Chitinophaga sp.]
MRKHFSLLLGLSLSLLIFSCQKKADHTDPSTEPSKHGMGAHLNPDAYNRLPLTNFDEVRKDLINKGYARIVENAKVAALPSRVILNHPSIGNQGATGTCVSWSSGYAAVGTLNNEFPSGVSNPRSPWYVYQVDHSSQGDCDPNDGMYIDAGLDILRNNGVPSYSVDSRLGSPCSYPTSAQNTDAARNKIRTYGRLSSVTDVKNALNLRLPVEMGLMVYSSFETAFDYGTIYKTTSGQELGGHAICIVGYDDAKHAFLIQNSWGTGGGDATYPGCMWLDYNVLSDSRLGVELYSVSK